METARRWATRLLVGLLLLGAAARGRHFLRGHSYWYDEAYLLLNVFGRSWGDLLGPLADEQAAPPLFLFLLRGLYLLGGPSEWVMRLPAIAGGLAALGLMVPLARRVVGRPGWLVAAGLGAVCHQAVAHGCEVKPYAIDLFVSEWVLLAAAAWLRPDGRGRSARAALLTAALVGPLLSYPSVFVLGAASAALLLDAVRHRERSRFYVWAAFNFVLLASVIALWFAAARHHHSPYLEKWWAGAFPDLSSPWAALAWTARYLVEVGHYGASGLGVPLAVLAVAGAVVLGRRAPELAVLLAGPLALAWVAGALHAYPLGDRLLLFAAPCVWLAAAVGSWSLIERIRGIRPRSAGWAAVTLGLLLPGAVRMAGHLVRQPFAAEFREAFDYVRRHRAEGDPLWVSHPQVYEVYHGRPPWLLGAYTPADQVQEAARDGRLWVVMTPQSPGLTRFPELFLALDACGCREAERHAVQGLEVVCYEPPSPRPQGYTAAPRLHASVTQTRDGSRPK
jgi:hypothetical protein